MSSIFYLETSGLNYLADRVANFDLIARAKSALGFELYLSPITIWEILLSSSDERKDRLIYWGQFNCASKLLKSPGEIVLDFIERGCPEREKRDFRSDPFTKIRMGATWESIHGKIDRTIPVDVEALKLRTAPLRELSRALREITDWRTSVGAYQDPFITAAKRACANLGLAFPESEGGSRFLFVGAIVCFFVFCMGAELENNILHEFWRTKKVNDPLDRLDYVVDRFPRVLTRGPVAGMAQMAVSQLESTRGETRGLFHDCFHAVYCYYVDNFISADEHFSHFRDATKHPSFDNIIMTSQLEEIWARGLRTLEPRLFSDL